MKDTIIIYHANCLDGIAAAWAAWTKFKETAEYIPLNYGDIPPNVENKDVYILDFSFKREILLEMKEKAKSLLVIDHHKTAEEELKDLHFCLFNQNNSGCVLSWKFFNPKTNIPLFLTHIEDRDLWKFHLKNTKEFCEYVYFYFNKVNRNFEEMMNFFENLYLKDKYLEIYDFGKIILEKKETEIKTSLFHKHLVLIDGNKQGLACNSSQNISEIGHELAKLSGTFGLVYYFNGEKWLYSLRSEGDYDVSRIVKVYGGGGHKNAAGFSLPSLII